MRHGVIAQQTPGVVDQKSRRIQHYQNFSDQRLCHRLSCFAGDGLRNFGFSGIAFFA